MKKLSPEIKAKKLTAIYAYQKRGLSLRQIATKMGYKNVNSITHLLKDKS